VDRKNDRRRRRGTGFDFDAQALFNRMTTPPTVARKILINDFIVTLKNDGNWEELDVLVVLAAADSQAALLDFKNLSDGALVNAPTFVADRGFTGDGATSYINSQFNPTTDAVKFTQNDASAGCYLRTDNQTVAYSMGLVKITTAEGTGIIPRTGADQSINRLNSDTNHTIASANSLGLFSMNRTGAALFQDLKNGADAGTEVDTSQAFENGNFFHLARNVVGTGASNFDDRQQALYFYGSGSLNHATFFTALETYLDAIGAGVV